MSQQQRKRLLFQRDCSQAQDRLAGWHGTVRSAKGCCQVPGVLQAGTCSWLCSLPSPALCSSVPLFLLLLTARGFGQLFPKAGRYQPLSL